jgi:hypothetical protein
VTGNTGPAGPKGATGPAGPSNPTLVNASNTTTTAAAGTTLQVQVSCPSGKLLGGGGQATTAPTTLLRVALSQSYPSSPTQWTVVGVINTALGGSNRMTVTAYAICQ